MKFKYLIVNKNRVKNLIERYDLYIRTLNASYKKLSLYYDKVNDRSDWSYLVKHMVKTQSAMGNFQMSLEKMKNVKFWTPGKISKYKKFINDFHYIGELQEVIRIFKYLEYNEIKGQKFIPELDPFGEENWEG